MSSANQELRHPLARVRGLGSAKEGVQHWWVQRVTAVALIPLGLWFVGSIISLAGADHATVVDWLRSPFDATLMVLLIVTMFYHSMLGCQVVIEDYVHDEWLKLPSMLLMKAAHVLLGLGTALAVLRIAFQG